MGGLAIAPLPLSSVKGDLKVLSDELPAIGYYEIELRQSSAASGPLVDALTNHIINNFRSYDDAVAA
jgi:hypothetical protein